MLALSSACSPCRDRGGLLMSAGLVVADCFRKQPGPGAQSCTAVRTASPLLEEAPRTHNGSGVKVGPGSTSSVEDTWEAA